MEHDVTELDFTESANLSIIKPVESAKGSDWDVVIIQPGISLNDNFYPVEVLKKAAPLFENAKACAYRHGSPLGNRFDHVDDAAARVRPSGFSENVVGFFKNVHYGSFVMKNGKKGEGLLARFHVLEGHDWLRKNLRDAWEQGQPNLLGFSIDAKGSACDVMIDGKKVRRVESISEVRSTDVVTDPAAGGAIIRLVASLPVDYGLQEATKLGNFIGERMKRDNVEASKLAAAAGITESTIGQIVRGEIKRPPDKRLIGIARVLRVSFKMLLDLIPKEIREAYAMDRIYAAIRENRASWLKGFAQPEVNTDMNDYMLRVLEANIENAHTVLKEMPMDEIVSLAEITRGVKALEEIMSLIKNHKMDEATDLLQSMIESMNDADGPQESQRKSFYSYPYKPHTGKDTNSEDGTSEPAAKETVMDDKKTSELSEADQKRIANLEVREKAMAKRERDATITEKVKASDLPELAKTRMIETLCASGAEMDEAAIDAAIVKEAEYVKSFGGPVETKPDLGDAYDQAPAASKRSTVAVSQDQRETWSKAFDGMFDGGMPVDGVQPFRSLHEAFGKITGKYYDREEMAHFCFAGIKMALPGRASFNCVEKHLAKLKEGYNPYRYDTSFKEAIGTGDYPIAFGDSLFRRLQKEFDAPELNDWRQIISSIENLTDLNNDFNLVRIGYTGVMPVVPQAGPYQEVSVDPTEANEKLVPSKHGFLLKLTWEDMLADRIGVMRRIPSILGRSAARTIQQKVWDQIETNPTMDADSVALINATHANLVTGSPTLSFTAVTDAIRLLRNQTEQDSGEKLGLNPAFLLVSPTREQQAVEITGSNVKVTATEDGTIANFVRRLGVQAFPTVGLGRTTGTNEFRWYLAASPKDAETIAVGFLGGRDRPDLFVQSPVDTPTSGASFEADALTFKIRLGVGAKVADHRWIAGSLATT